MPHSGRRITHFPRESVLLWNKAISFGTEAEVEERGLDAVLLDRREAYDEALVGDKEVAPASSSCDCAIKVALQESLYNDRKIARWSAFPRLIQEIHDHFSL